nr:hypothetical protein [uncultured Capnocytophaga sp.]
MKLKLLFCCLLGLVACQTDTKIPLFGTEDYLLTPNEQVLTLQTPMDDSYAFVTSQFFADEQLPIFKITRHKDLFTYITIPIGLHFEQKHFSLPPELTLIDQQETDDTKFLSYQRGKTFNAIYLRKIRQNTICLIVVSPDETQFKTINKSFLDQKIQLRNE